MAAKMPGWKDLVVGILDLALSYRQRLIERAQRSSGVSLKGKIYLRDDSAESSESNCRRSTVLWDCTSSGSRATTTSPTFLT
jgi:hypothetical protein